jgi:hypothetical protein
MDNTKSILQSKTAWGAGIAILASVAGMLGYTVSSSDQAQALDLFSQLYDIADRLVIIGGGALAIWGRIKATHKIG